MLFLSDDDDCIRYEPDLDSVWPRLDSEGNIFRDWSVQRRLAVEELERRLRSRRATRDRFQLGQLGLRAREVLRPAEACLTLHFIFEAVDTQGPREGFYARKSRWYWDKAWDIVGSEQTLLDYDSDNSGTVDANEENQSISTVFTRG